MLSSQMPNPVLSNQLLVLQLDDAKDLPLPKRGTPYSSGLDLYAHVDPVNGETLESGEFKLVSAGIKMVIPEGYEVQIRPRSGLAIRHGIGIINSPSTIDNDYRGELKVPMINHGPERFIINRGDRFAQMVVCPVSLIHDPIPVYPEVFDRFSDTERGEAGYGSTGVN